MPYTDKRLIEDIQYIFSADTPDDKLPLITKLFHEMRLLEKDDVESVFLKAIEYYQLHKFFEMVDCLAITAQTFFKIVPLTEYYLSRFLFVSDLEDVNGEISNVEYKVLHLKETDGELRALKDEVEKMQRAVNEDDPSLYDDPGLNFPESLKSNIDFCNQEIHRLEKLLTPYRAEFDYLNILHKKQLALIERSDKSEGFVDVQLGDCSAEYQSEVDEASKSQDELYWDIARGDAKTKSSLGFQKSGIVVLKTAKSAPTFFSLVDPLAESIAKAARDSASQFSSSLSDFFGFK